MTTDITTLERRSRLNSFRASAMATTGYELGQFELIKEDDDTIVYVDNQSACGIPKDIILIASALNISAFATFCPERTKIVIKFF